MANELLLIVEDEENIRELLRYQLTREGYRVLQASSVAEANRCIAQVRPDLILLDLMLPDVDGLEYCRRLKSATATSGIPVIMLTAKHEEADVVVGLEMGADDYVAKPFSPRVLLARIRAVLRRLNEPDALDDEETPIRAGPVTLYPERHQTLVAGRNIDLTATEFRVLCLLARRPGWVFSRGQISGDAHSGEAGADRSVDVQIVALRRKLGVAGRHIETVRGVGYRFNESL